MHGGLARKLRILGFDTAYFKEGTDDELALVAEDEGRVILTSDKQLVSRANSRGLGVLPIQGDDDRARLLSLIDRANDAHIELRPGPSRCATCNGALVRAEKTEIAGRVPRQVVARHRLYYRCTDCGSIYWKGGHWQRLRRLASLVNGARTGTPHKAPERHSR